MRDGRVVFVGAAADAQAWIGPKTRIENLGGRLVLPGLIDSHIHPLDIADLDVCDLDNRELSLKELSRFVPPASPSTRRRPGGCCTCTSGISPPAISRTRNYPTLRAALDAASTTRAIELQGQDGHHAAFNSLALSQASNSAGQVVGFSKATLATDFAAFKAFVGVDEHGEPNGAVNEDARAAISDVGRAVPGAG